MANELRLSGAQTVPRSESDIRFNYNNFNQIIAAANVEAVSAQGNGFASQLPTSKCSVIV
jgi:hypothetical protein